MPVRYRWYRIQLPRALDISEVISGRPLTKGKNFGFSRFESSFGELKFRFLWRANLIVTKLDEQGTPFHEEVATVNFTDFSVIHLGGNVFLRVENPGRNIRDLLNAIESLVGLGFTSKPLTFQKAKPTTIFDNVDVAKLVGLKVVDVVVDEDLLAKMEFASKEGMAGEEMKLLEGLNYKVDYAAFELIYEGVRGQATFVSSGVVKLSGPLTPKLLALIERDLNKFM